MQIDAGKLQRSKGTGLGLALCKNVVELHGGSVGFESELGAGSSFFFSVPMQLCLLDAAESLSRSTTSVTRSVATAPTPALTVRTTEEDQTFRALLTPTDGVRPLLMRHYSSTIGVSGTVPSDHALRPAPPATLTREMRHENAGDHACVNSSSSIVSGGIVQQLSIASSTDESSDADHFSRTELLFSASPASNASNPSPAATSMEAAHLAAGMVACSNTLPLWVARNALPHQGSDAANAATPSFAIPVHSSPIPVANRAGRSISVIRLKKGSADKTPPIESRVVGNVAVNGDSAVRSAAAVVEPLTKATPADSSTLPSTHAASSPRPSSPPVRVLVVEDSAPNRKLLCALLTRLRCAVTAVENGQLCVDLMRPHFDAPSAAAAPGPPASGTAADPAAASQRPQTGQLPFDIVLMVSTTGTRTDADGCRCIAAPQSAHLLFAVSIRPLMLFFCLFVPAPCPPVQDNSMPVMDGVTATRLLREGGIALPVVGVTGNALEEDIRSFMNGGATEILVRSQARQRWTDSWPAAVEVFSTHSAPAF
jgi:CheY-like chemotaxis protein